MAESTPQEPLFELPGPRSTGPEAAVAEAATLLIWLREDYRLPTMQSDKTLHTLAREPLTRALAGTWDRATEERRLRGAGFVGGPATQILCHGPTVSLCLDEAMADPLRRQALLEPRHRVFGVAAQVATDAVTMVINLASE